MLNVEFMGANFTEQDGEREYHPTSQVSINLDLINGFYDHAILTGGMKIRVMEDYEAIRKKIREAETWKN